MLPSLVQTHIVRELLMSRCRFNSESLNTKFTETFANVGPIHSKDFAKYTYPSGNSRMEAGLRRRESELTCFDKNETPGTLVREVPLTWVRPRWGGPRSPARCDAWGLRGMWRGIWARGRACTSRSACPGESSLRRAPARCPE